MSPRMNTVLIFVVISTTFLRWNSVSARVSNKRSEFGEPCNKTLKCSGSAWLACVGGTCTCAKQNEMIFDKILRKCVSKAGERCRYEIDSSSSEIKIFEKSDCVSNAMCGSHGTCICLDEFYEALNGTCLRKGEYTDQCTSDLECRSDMSLKCVENVCQCDTTRSDFSVEQNNCVGLGGHPCVNDKCTENAECHDDGLCACFSVIYRDDGTAVELFQNENGNCLPQKGRFEFCNSTEECKKTDAFLTCVDGKCDCESGKTTYELVQGYNSYRNYAYWYECVGLAGKLCNPSRHCVTNSDCNEYSNNCSCHDDYTVTSTGHCGRSYGESCDGTEVCSDMFTCRGSTCTCKHIDQSTYSSGKCQSIAYGPCRTNNDCIETAECIENQGEATGYCKCKKGFVENNLDGCDLQFGSACNNTGISCDTLASLECLNGVCSCRDSSMIFDKINRQCLGLVGYICKRSTRVVQGGSRKTYNCVQNAVCHSVHDDLPGHCKCLEGYRKTSERTCAKIDEHISSPPNSIAAQANNDEDKFLEN